MKLRILQTTQGSPDGIRIVTFKAGEELDGSDPRLTKKLAKLFCEDGRAELVADAVPTTEAQEEAAGGNVVIEEDADEAETEAPTPARKRRQPRTSE